jgi:hypothetical protein
VDSAVRVEPDPELRPGEIERVRPDDVLLVAVEDATGCVEARGDASRGQNLDHEVLAPIAIGPAGREQPHGQLTVSRGTETVHVAIVTIPRDTYAVTTFQRDLGSARATA